jgi:hypothetical protein
MSFSLVLQVFAKGVITGEGGKITTFTAMLSRQAPVPVVPAGVFPQAWDKTYRACTEWHPGVVDDGEAV